jgi:hypothetical protein
MFLRVLYMPKHLKWRLLHARCGLAQPLVRDGDGARGRLDLRCAYGAPWRIDQGPGEANEIPYHAVIGGSAVLENQAGGRQVQLKAGDILLLPGNPARDA